MQYIFILGKNSQLSTAEILAYLEARADFKVVEKSEQFLAVETDFRPNIDELGGTLKIAEVLTNEREYDFYPVFKDIEKALFAVSSYGSNEQKHYAELIKEQMKEHKIKAGYLHSEEPISHTILVKKKTLKKSFEIIICSGKNFYIARTILVHNPFEFQKRDIGRPAQRAIFAISPRLSKIMINLTKESKGTLLDPFCGIGSILQEAGLMGFKVLGTDTDEKCVSDCITNLEWIEKEYKVKIEKEIVRGDATNLPFKDDSIGAIVTEPYLGPPLKERPDEFEAKNIIKEIQPLYEKSLKEIRRVLKSKKRAVIIFPFFETLGKNIRLEIRPEGFIIVDRFEDFEDRHKTLREIVVLEKL